MKWRLILFFTILFGILCSMNAVALNSTLYDLEELLDDSIVESKKIEIPGHPYAFNPSVVKWNGIILMSFREIPYPYNPDHGSWLGSGDSRIGIVRLDENFNPITIPQMLTTQENYLLPVRSEDARLIVVGESLFIAYSDNKEEELTVGGFRMYLAELIYDGQNFILKGDVCLRHFEGMRNNRREKNWVPFEYNGTLLFAYSLNPHRVLKPYFGFEHCETIAETRMGSPWSWGDLRGGTPAIKVDGHYLSFFHSCIDMRSIQSNGKKMLHYFMGAYTFSAEPPFEIIKISQMPIVGRHFYNGEYYTPYWKPVRVIFPCGIILDDHFIWVSYGREDHECWVVKINKTKLFDSLGSVQ